MFKPQPNLMILKPKSEAMLGRYSAEQRYVSDVKYPPEGGILSYFTNERFPEKQLVYPEIFGFLNPFKRSMTFLPSILSSMLGKIVVFLFLIFCLNKKFRKLIVERYTEMFWSGWYVVGIEHQYFCTAARELRRSAIAQMPSKNLYIERLITMVVAFFECDNAYRYRMQDFFGIVNKNKLLLNPSKEITRALNEFSKREQNGQDWLSGKIAGLVSLFKILILIPKYKKLFLSFITELDFDKVRLDIMDRYWCYHRTDYNADGLDLIDRMKKRQLLMKAK